MDKNIDFAQEVIAKDFNVIINETRDFNGINETLHKMKNM